MPTSVSPAAIPLIAAAGERRGRRGVEADQGGAVGRERDGRNAGEAVLDREAAGGRDAVEEGADQRGGAAEQVDAVETDGAGDGQQRVTGAGGHRVVGRCVDAARDVETVGIGEVDAERADRELHAAVRRVLDVEEIAQRIERVERRDVAVVRPVVGVGHAGDVVAPGSTCRRRRPRPSWG